MENLLELNIQCERGPITSLTSFAIVINEECDLRNALEEVCIYHYLFYVGLNIHT